MRPVFVIAPPRCRASLLVRMLSGNPAVRLIENPDKREHFGRALSYRSRTGWDAAVSTWSWVLGSWPDARIIFLNRDQGAIEARMAVSTQYQWIPKWGKCLGCCGRQVKDMLESMADFHDLNPSRTRLVESDDLLDYDKSAAILKELGIALERGVWEREIAIKSYPTSQPVPVFTTDPADDPFHPLATIETADKLPGSRKPNMVDPLAEGAAWELADALPGPKKPNMRQILAMPPMPQIRLEVDPDHKAVNPAETVVHTIRFGNPDWLPGCVQTLEDWCHRHGYDLMVHGKPAVNLPSEKFLLVDALRDFLAGDKDRMIYIDADVMIHPSAPGWPDGFTGFCTRSDASIKVVKKWEKWRAKSRQACADGWVYRNAGVWSCDREAARRFLEEVPPVEEWVAGMQEQHQWNVWWARAYARGMQMRDLPHEWNRISGAESAVSWFYHIAGKEKTKILEKIRARRQLPVAGIDIKETPPSGPIAIAWLWSKRHAAWDELRFSMRSALAHFADVPMHIFGDEKPEWLVDHPKVTFHLAPAYEDALSGALQCADQVVLMNDDIYFLRPCRVDDLRVALTRRKPGSLVRRLGMNVESENSWLNGVADATSSMMHYGYDPIMDFSTHTPYLFEREKSLATLRLYGLWRKMPFESLYHNQHRTEFKPVTGLKTAEFPFSGDPWFLNHGGGLPSKELRDCIEKMFPNPSPWESI